MYDLRVDPFEQFNLIENEIYDIDRHITAPSKEMYLYPYWDDLENVRKFFRNIKEKMWRTGSFSEEIKPKVKYFIQTHGYNQIIRRIPKKK